MPIHPDVGSRSSLLEGLPSSGTAMADVVASARTPETLEVPA